MPTVLEPGFPIHRQPPPSPIQMLVLATPKFIVAQQVLAVVPAQDNTLALPQTVLHQVVLEMIASGVEAANSSLPGAAE